MTVKKAKTTKKTKNAWQLTTIPVHSWITFWVLVLATMALATVCFANAFKTAEGEIDTESVEAFKAIQKSLEDQVADLQAKAGIELTSKSDFPANCLSNASSTIDNYVTYTDEEKTYSARIPYSTGWSSMDCPVAPADIVSGHVLEFGPYTPQHEMEYPIRDSLLASSDQKMTAAELRTKLQGPQEGTLQNLRQRTINGIPVFSYSLVYAHGITRNYWEALGRTYTYKISSEGWLTDAEAIKIIQSLRVEN